MKSLLFVAHGSKKQSANYEVELFAQQLHNILADSGISLFKYAFLEFAEPSIKKQINNLIELGSNHIIVFPYFTTAGKHVSTDIPNAIEYFKHHNPTIKFSLCEHLGNLEEIHGLVANNIRKHL